MMTAALKWALFAILLTQAAKPSPGYTSTASYEELLQAVKSGKFTVDKANKAKDNSQDILQELLNKSEFCFIQLDHDYPVLVGRIHWVNTKTSNLKI